MNLINSAKAVVERWDTPLWKDAPASAVLINQLRAAIEEAEKQEPVAYNIVLANHITQSAALTTP